MYTDSISDETLDPEEITQELQAHREQVANVLAEEIQRVVDHFAKSLGDVCMRVMSEVMTDIIKKSGKRVLAN